MTTFRPSKSPLYCAHCGDPRIMHMPEDMACVKQIEGATAVQVGGSHYKDMAIQPIEYIAANGLGYHEGNVVKYVSRWRSKNGVEDLKKARHYLDILIESQECGK